MADISPRRPHAEVMDELKRKLNAITEVIPRDRPVIFLDYPIHGNVGDLLIHAGTERFFAANGYRLAGHFSIHEFCLTHRPGKPIAFFKESVRRLDELVKVGGTIVFQGGGNLGDLYRDHQTFRELVIGRYPDTPIVILPQSVHFDDYGNRAATAKVFGAHRHLHVFARDRESLGYVRDECGVASALMPDMAHALWGSLPQVAENKIPTLHFRRRDKEANADASADIETFDWDDAAGALDRGMIRLLRKMQSADFPSRYVVPNHIVWNLYRNHLLRRSIGHVGRYGRLVTDRLHGLILGALLAMPVICEDNSYGKVSRYYTEWFVASDRVVYRVRRKTPSVEPAPKAPASQIGALKQYGI